MREDELVCALEVVLVLGAEFVDGLRDILLLLAVVPSLLEFYKLFALLHALQLLNASQLLLRGVHHEQRVLDEVLLDDVIERRVGGEARSVVDLQQKDAVLVVYHEIKAEELEAHIGGCLLRPADFIIGEEVGLRRDNSLDDVVLDLTPIGIGAVSHLLETLEELGEGLLVAVRHVIDRVIVLIVGVGLVDGVIGEMHEVIGEVGAAGQLVLLRGESDQSLVVEVDAQGAETC